MKLRVALVLLLAVSLQVSLVFAKGGPCSALKLPAVQKSKTYDLSSLSTQTFEASNVGDSGTTTFTWTLCGSVQCDGKPAGACQKLCRDGNCFSGVAAVWDPSNVIVVAPSSGTGVGIQETNQFERLVNLVVICDPKAKTPTNPTAVVPTNTGAPTVLSITHVSGCGVKGGISGGSVCLIIFFVGFGLYFIGGFIFLKFVRKHEGIKECIPNYEFWSDLPVLMKDGWVFLLSKTCRRSGYETVA